MDFEFNYPKQEINLKKKIPLKIEINSNINEEVPWEQVEYTKLTDYNLNYNEKFESFLPFEENEDYDLCF